MDCVASIAKCQVAKLAPAGAPAALLLLLPLVVGVAPAVEVLVECGGYDLGFLVYMFAVNWVSL